MLRPLTHVNPEEGPARVEAGRGPRPPGVVSASSDGTTAPDAFSDPAVMLGSCPLAAELFRAESRAAALTCLNSNMKKNLHQESKSRLELSKPNGNLFSSRL